MSIQCAKCKYYACRRGRPDAAPGDCPMHGDFPAFEQLYSDPDSKRLAHRSALVEALGYGRWNRLREIAEFAERMGFKRLGIAYCPDMVREAVLAATYLRSHLLDVRLPPEEFDCDPVGQATLFGRLRTHMNVIAGMCVGHEAVFTRASRAPLTALVARDERFCHNPAAALYTSDTYARASLYRPRRERKQTRFRGWETDTLLEVSQELLPDKHGTWNRLQETIEFANRLGVAHIGLSFCVGFRNEARILTKVLEANGFRVTSVCCKSGAVPKEQLGLEDSQKIRPGQPEMMCNPLAQAELLNREGVELALVLGQCVGHDSATIGRLQAPAVCLVVKDRVLAHNTVAALYRLEG
jgi:uncharacterized metal-binding protein